MAKMFCNSLTSFTFLKFCARINVVCLNLPQVDLRIYPVGIEE